MPQLSLRPEKPCSPAQRLLLYVAWQKGTVWRAHSVRTSGFQRAVAEIRAKGWITGTGAITIDGVAVLNSKDW